MKLFVLIILTNYAFAGFAQAQVSGNGKNDSSFNGSISFSTFNHASMLFRGTTTCLLTDSFIKVSNTSFGGKNTKTLYTKTFTAPQNLNATINNWQLDSLKDFYFNSCIMMTSGNEYSLNVKSNTITKHINLHHFYLKQLDDIINMLNTYLPEKYQFSYLTKDDKQDCSIR